MVSWNVLCPAYTPRDRYPDAAAEFFDAAARRRRVAAVIASRPGWLWALQEADIELAATLRTELAGDAQVLYAAKRAGRPDGCAYVIPAKYELGAHAQMWFADGTPRSGHCGHIIELAGLTIANTHLRWSAPGDPDPIRARQAAELVARVGAGPAVVCGDLNDAPGGPARRVLATAGFVEVQPDGPTAVVNSITTAALDVVAARSISAAPAEPMFELSDTMQMDGCPSDHIPVGAHVTLTR